MKCLIIDCLKICIIRNWKETKDSSGLMVNIKQLMIHSIDVKAKNECANCFVI